jgi:hypothetical protein
VAPLQQPPLGQSSQHKLDHLDWKTQAEFGFQQQSNSRIDNLVRAVPIKNIANEGHNVIEIIATLSVCVHL